MDTIALPSPANAASLQLPDAGLIRRFDHPGPRYTSYPTADRFHNGFGPDAYAQQLAQRGEHAANQALSLYVHIPFCTRICHYCACNKIGTRHKERGWEYLDYIDQEAHLLTQHLSGSRQISQLHLGGGTPTFLEVDGLAALMKILGQYFAWQDDGEYSIELDPRTLSNDMMRRLRAMGFNRASLGVQDFDPVVQKAVNRVQPYELVEQMVLDARDAGFASLNFDLIYGLPHQTRHSFAASLAQTLALRPDRIALYSYAHLPARFAPQRSISEADLPSPAEKLQIMLDAIVCLSEAGYEYVGMDHFALPNDDLAVARRQGGLQRNFQGYSTQADCDLIGLGVSAISKVGSSYAQNHHDLDNYVAALARGELPITRGLALTTDDRLRRAVIMTIMCDGMVDKAAISQTWQLDFDTYFAQDLALLKPHIEAGLVEHDTSTLRVTPLGRLLVRTVAMAFDARLRAGTAVRYSRTI